MSEQKQDISLIMSVLDELLESGYHLIRDPNRRRNDTWKDGWGGSKGSGKVEMVSFTFTVTKPTREEVERRVSEVVRGFREGQGL